MPAPENPKSTKNPITLKIKFKSSSLEQFIERYSVDVSKGGIFIRTKEPLAVGTSLRFEFQLQDGNPLLSGDGTVVWNRAFDPNKSNVAPGMGVRFEKLTADSQKTLDQILAEKGKRGESNLESRFDAGVRALREESTETSQSWQNNQADNGGFGDEPTRAMAADQVNKLASLTIQEDEAPTKTSAPADLSEEVRKAMGTAADAVGKLTPMVPMSAGASGAPQPLGRTLIGQGFMMQPKAQSGGTGGGSSGKDGPSVEISSTPAISDSAKTPTASVEDQQAHVANSNRTPTNPQAAEAKSPEPKSAEVKPVEASGSLAPAAATSSDTPAASSANKPLPPPPKNEPVVAPESAGPRMSEPPTKSSSKGMLVGMGVVVLAILGAVGYVVTNGQKPTTTPPITQPTTNPVPPPVVPPTPDPQKTPGTQPVVPEVKPEQPKPPEPANVPVKPEPPADGVEVVTKPAGAQIEFAGKSYGPSPVHIPGLVAGSQLILRLPGFQAATVRLRTAPDKSKALEYTLQPAERLIEVVSVPKGAEVWVDGKKVGKTPFVIKKLDMTKAHLVEVKRAGFQVWSHNVSDTETFTVKNRKEVLTLTATLEAAEAPKKAGKRAAKEEPAAVTPAATTPAATTPAATTPAAPASAPAAAAPAEAKPAEEKPAEAKPAEAKPAEEKPAEAAK